MHQNSRSSPSSALSTITSDSTPQVWNANTTTSSGSHISYVNPIRFTKPNHRRDVSSQPLSSWETRINSIFDAECVIDSDLDTSGYRTIADTSAYKTPQRYKSPSSMKTPQPIQSNASFRSEIESRKYEDATTATTTTTIKGSTVLKILIDSGANSLNYSVLCTETPERHTQVTTIALKLAL